MMLDYVRNITAHYISFIGHSSAKSSIMRWGLAKINLHYRILIKARWHRQPGGVLMTKPRLIFCNLPSYVSVLLCEVPWPLMGLLNVNV